jgi:hypothetical protein
MTIGEDDHNGEQVAWGERTTTRTDDHDSECWDCGERSVRGRSAHDGERHRDEAEVASGWRGNRKD